MKMKKFLTSLLLAFVALCLVACGGGNNGGEDQPKTEDYSQVAQTYLGQVAITYADGDTKDSVTKDVTLGTVTAEGLTISWASNNAALTNDGKVTRGEKDTDVTLTVTLKYKDVELTKSFNVTVKAKEEEKPVETKVSTVAEALAAENGVNVRVNATVVATNAKGYYLWDGTGFIQYFLGNDATISFANGDYVDVEGAVNKYNEVNQFTSTATAKKITTGTPYEVSFEEMDEAAFTTYLANVELGKKVKVEFTVTSVSSSYVNGNIKGSELVGVAINAPTEKFEEGASYEVVLFSTHAKEYQGVNYLYGYLEESVLTEPAPLPTYTVTFDSNGGSEVDPIDFQDYTTVELPESKLFGFFFLGWEDENGQSVEALTANKNYTLKATWAQADCDIIVDLDGGKFATTDYLDASNKRHFDAAIFASQIEVPTKEGFVFLGWMDLAGVLCNNFSGEVEIKAKWGTSLEIKFNCGPSIDMLDAIAAEFLTDFNAFYPGHGLTVSSFFGSTYTADGTAVVANFFNDATYGVKWKWLLDYIDELRAANDAGSILDAAAAQQRGDIHNWLNACASGEKGGTKGYGQDFGGLSNYAYILTNLGTSYTLPTLTAKGYTFLGWYNNSEFEGEALTTVTNGLELYAKFEETKYTVEYVLPEGWTNSEKNPAYFTFFSEDIALEAATSTGSSTFVGWYLEPEFINKVEKINAGSTGAIKLYARVLEGTPVTVTFDYNNAYTPQEVVAMFIADVEATSGKTGYLATPAKTAWSSAVDCTPLSTIINWSDKGENGPAKKAFLARWNWYFQIIYDAQATIGTNFYPNVAFVMGGTPDSTGLFIIGLESKGIRDNVQAINWYGATMYDWSKDAEAPAEGEANNFLLKIAEGSKTATKTDLYAAGSAITEVSAKNGCTFIGWYDNAEGIGEAYTTVPNENVTLYAFFHNPTTLYVDPNATEDATHFTSVYNALDAAYDGDTIVVAAGTYVEALEVAKKVKFVGPNAEKFGFATDRAAEAIISGAITVKADDVEIVGFSIANQIDIEANIENFKFNNNAQTSAAGQIDGQGFVMKNAEFCGNYAPELAVARWIYLGTVENLKCNNNVIIGSGKNLFDVFRVQTKLSGTCEFVGNTVENSQQSVFMVMGVGQLTATIQDNTFKNITNTAIDFRGKVGEDAVANVINIIHNKFEQTTAYGWTVIRPRALNYTETDTLTVNILYNVFGDKCLNGASQFFENWQNIAHAITVVAHYNFFQEVKAADLVDANFGGYSADFANNFDNVIAVESAYNAYIKKTAYTITLDGVVNTVYDVIGFELGTKEVEGDTFLGWYEGDTKVDALTEMRNYNLSSKWQNGSLVSFDSNGGSACDSIVYDEYTDLASLPQPTKDGYTFICWMNGDAEFVVNESLVVKNYLLVAKWALNFTVTYDYNVPAVATFNLRLLNTQRSSRFILIDNKSTTATYWSKLFLKATETPGLYTVVAANSGKAINTFDASTFDIVVAASIGNCADAAVNEFMAADKLEGYIGLKAFITGDISKMPTNTEAADGEYVILFTDAEASNYGKKVVQLNESQLPYTIEEVATFKDHSLVGWFKEGIKTTKLTAATDIELSALWVEGEAGNKMYNTLEEIKADYLADFNAANSFTGKDESVFSTSMGESSWMATMLSNEAMNAKWAWLYAVIAEVADVAALATPSAANASETKQKMMPSLYSLFNGVQFSDPAFGAGADFSIQANVDKVLAAIPEAPKPIYNTVAEIAAAFVADFVTVAPNATSAENIDTSKIDSGQITTMLTNETFNAKWGWLYTAIYTAAGSPADTDWSNASTDLTKGAVKGFYIANLCGFLTQTSHKDTYLGTQSADWTNAELVNAVLAAVPTK